MRKPEEGDRKREAKRGEEGEERGGERRGERGAGRGEMGGERGRRDEKRTSRNYKVGRRTITKSYASDSIMENNNVVLGVAARLRGS